MEIFYFLALIPVLIGAVIWFTNHKIVWWEWLMGAGASMICASIMHFIVSRAMTTDYDTFSGHVETATYYPWWQSHHLEAVYKTETYRDSDGNTQTRQVFSHYRDVYTDHPERWEVSCYFGTYLRSKDYDISKSKFEEIVSKWGSPVAQEVYKPDFHKGDRNIYVVSQNGQYVFPVTTLVYFENKIKASKTLYDFPPVPEGVQVYDYPTHDLFQSNRLLGNAAQDFSIREIDLLNSRLGPLKKVNLIIVGFGDSPEGIVLGHYLQARWIGGKKNDLVVTYGGTDPLKPKWVYVFGWTDSEIVKSSITSILLTHGASDAVLPLISQEILKNYEIKEWRDFQYIRLNPPTWSYFVFIIFMGVSQTGLYIWFHHNDIDG